MILFGSILFILGLVLCIPSLLNTTISTKHDVLLSIGITISVFGLSIVSISLLKYNAG